LMDRDTLAEAWMYAQKVMDWAHRAVIMGGRVTRPGAG
jgi:hypothetical protein